VWCRGEPRARVLLSAQQCVLRRLRKERAECGDYYEGRWRGLCGGREATLSLRTTTRKVVVYVTAASVRFGVVVRAGREGRWGI
jgi:hypothetical protein